MQQLISDGRSGTFDFIFIDADKENCLKFTSWDCNYWPQKVIAVDNVLWMASRGFSNNDKETRAIRYFNKKLCNDPSVDISVVPISDGLTLIRKRIFKIIL